MRISHVYMELEFGTTERIIEFSLQTMHCTLDASLKNTINTATGCRERGKMDISVGYFVCQHNSRDLEVMGLDIP